MAALVKIDVAPLLTEFEDTYLAGAEGKRHLAAYGQSRDEGRRNWREIQELHSEGKDVTDLVLVKLLPHLNTPHNRERGAWIHIAPAITKDVKKWFENCGWTRPADWPQVAALVRRFVEQANADPSKLAAACAEFDESSYSKGMQSAFLSPILNALRPDDFLVLNFKSFEALRFLTGVEYSRKLRAYPESNAALRQLLEQLRHSLDLLRPSGALAGDKLDAFCHWLVAVKRATQEEEIEEGENDRESALDRKDAGSAQRVIERLLASEEERRQVVAAFAEAVREADRYGRQRWSVTLHRRKLRLNVGRLLSMELAEDRLRLGLAPHLLPGDVPEMLREEDEPETFATTPATAMFAMAPATFRTLWPRLLPAFREFLRIAAGTARKSPYTQAYSPGILAYLDLATGTKLPRPAHDESQTELPKAIAVQTPRTVFKKVDYDLNGLLTYIENGDIGLPDIQRPFVWSTTKVRDLFDSMYRGFPVGYLLFWENMEIKGTRTIGLDAKQKVPSLLIVDGQQRLTSLYAVLRGKPVLDDRYASMQIEIAFRPRDGRFEVANAATRLDPEYIPSISQLWVTGRSSYSSINEFLQNLSRKRTLTDDDREAMSHNLDRLFDLQKYPFTALEITPAVDEEAVADIFVRINSLGVQLKQADFILTLLSVFWEEGRRALEEFSRDAKVIPASRAPSPFNHLVQPTPDQLLRVDVALGFRRARLQSVYQVLRGKDVDTGQFLPERRDAQFDRLKDAQRRVLDLRNWHQFVGCIQSAGFRDASMISSETALFYTYALYLIGRADFSVEENALQRVITRWFFAAALTGRYTGTAETTMEQDLNRLSEVTNAEGFVDLLERLMAGMLTGDFWTIQLPMLLETSDSGGPAWSAFAAAQNRLGVHVLFSDKRLWEAMDPALRPSRKAVEAHHLFPRAWLEKNGHPERKERNQVANLAFVEWPDNVKVGANPPSVYAADVRQRFSAVAWERMCREHALPDGWESLNYPEFLERRRKLMAAVIRRGFDALIGSVSTDLHERIDEGTQTEQEAWRRIESLERTLRQLVRDSYETRWGASAESRIRKTLGESSWAAIERNRERYLQQYRLNPNGKTPEVLEFCYLGQLVQLMVANEAWDLFKAPFRDKRQLEDLIGSIVPVRNDAAHFRSVPQKELDRCRLAADDLRELVSQL